VSRQRVGLTRPATETMLNRAGSRRLENLPCIARVHNSVYTKGVDDNQNQLSARDARAHFAELITRAQGGTPTVITRNGQPVAAVVPIEDFNALEDAIDRYFAREADRDLAENPEAPTYSMSEVVAAIFEEEPGKGVA
jgi:prevent-host-death family protein